MSLEKTQEKATRAPSSTTAENSPKKNTKLRKAGIFLILLGLVSFAVTFLCWDLLSGQNYDGITILLFNLLVTQLGITFTFHDKKVVFYLCCVFHLILGEFILMSYALFGGLIYVILHVFANSILLILWSLNLFWSPSKKPKK